MKKQFCKHGHDIFIVGRDKHGNCKICSRESCLRYVRTYPEKNRERTLKWRKEHPDKKRDRENNWKILKIINLDGSLFTYVDYDILYQKQQGRCDICHQKKNLCVDHNHKTGIVRGLLCQKHNTALGYFEDIVFRTEAINYLHKYNKS